MRPIKNNRIFLSILPLFALLAALVIIFVFRSPGNKIKKCQDYVFDYSVSAATKRECYEYVKRKSQGGNVQASRVAALYSLTVFDNVKEAELQYRRAIRLGNNRAKLDLVTLLYESKDGKNCKEMLSILNEFSSKDAGEERTFGALRDSVDAMGCKN